MRRAWRRIRDAVFGRFDRARSWSVLNVVDALPIYAPGSAGAYPAKADLTLRTANLTLVRLGALTAALGGREVPCAPIREAPTTDAQRAAAVELGRLFVHYGSDKAAQHDYHHLYGALLAGAHPIRTMLEIGMGTNNTDVVSNMSEDGRPGASLRAFRDFLPGARIHGADVDRRILFREERIETHSVDQTDPDTLVRLAAALPEELDLIIDDGLHSTDANLATLQFALPKLALGGWAVIEDIGGNAEPLWRTVAALLPERYVPRLWKAPRTLVFAVQRVQ